MQLHNILKQFMFGDTSSFAKEILNGQYQNQSQWQSDDLANLPRMRI